jgi:hypothetical protein
MLISEQFNASKAFRETDAEPRLFHLPAIWRPNSVSPKHLFAFVFVQIVVASRDEDKSFIRGGHLSAHAVCFFEG